MWTSLTPEVSNLTLKSRYQTGKSPSSFKLKRDFNLWRSSKRKLEAASAEMIVGRELQALVGCSFAKVRPMHVLPIFATVARNCTT
jgi:hypothetical protein